MSFYERITNCTKPSAFLRYRRHNATTLLRFGVNLCVYTQTKQYTPITSAIPQKGLFAVEPNQNLVRLTRQAAVLN